MKQKIKYMTKARIRQLKITCRGFKAPGINVYNLVDDYKYPVVQSMLVGERDPVVRCYLAMDDDGFRVPVEMPVGAFNQLPTAEYELPEEVKP